MMTALGILLSLWLTFNAILFARLGVEGSRKLARDAIDNFYASLRGQS